MRSKGLGHDATALPSRRAVLAYPGRVQFGRDSKSAYLFGTPSDEFTVFQHRTPKP